MKGYAQSTQTQYLKSCTALIEHFGRPTARLSRDELRDYTELLSERSTSQTTLRMHLCALLFLYRKTPGMSEHVSFIALRKTTSKVPDVLSQAGTKSARGGPGLSRDFAHGRLCDQKR